MAGLSRLVLANFRNISSADIALCCSVNLFYGVNGSGKTSVLEAVHMLATGRSFRSRQHQPVIQADAEQLAVFGRLKDGLTIGVEKRRSGPGGRIRINREAAESSSQLAALLPLQLINSDSFSALEGGPGVRRRLLDWTVFHVEQSYLHALKDYQIALRQRNALLRRGKIGSDQLDIWDGRMVIAAVTLDRLREEVFERLGTVTRELLLDLPVSPLQQVSIRYRRGWKQGVDLGEALQASRDADMAVGHTRVGPHRADMVFTVDSQPAQSILSRGQQKMLVCALRTAMARVVSNSRKPPVFLIDDLPAELDDAHQVIFARWVSDCAGQVLVTGIERESTCRPWLSLAAPWNKPSVFHVEHGRISAELDPAPNNEWSE
ncbi:DNA replication and repair protein RecF [Microbulbifer aggregans]|uniref:DNA replication and repair protein RecF n=1 Tax=Microbulbifer aggregans TaxID=1769779 RepID=A0A1C9W5D7_9GAMM|nr:DNA replication and repair protein RecF [Microbulbifer aggregans]